MDGQFFFFQQIRWNVLSTWILFSSKICFLWPKLIIATHFWRKKIKILKNRRRLSVGFKDSNGRTDRQCAMCMSVATFKLYGIWVKTQFYASLCCWMYERLERVKKIKRKGLMKEKVQIMTISHTWIFWSSVLLFWKLIQFHTNNNTCRVSTVESAVIW